MKRILFGIMLVTAILFSTGTASAKATRIDFIGTEVCDPDSFVGDLRLAGPNAQVNHITQTCYDTASIPQLTGTSYLIDGSVHIVGTAPNVVITGKGRLESVEGGVWVSSWVLPANSTTIKVVSHGEGLYAGMEVHSFFIDDGSGVSTFSGYILIPGN